MFDILMPHPGLNRTRIVSGIRQGINASVAQQWIGNAIPAHLPRRAIFRRGHGGQSRLMDGRRSNSLFEHADCFGFDGVMFGGDWPKSEFATSYQRLAKYIFE